MNIAKFFGLLGLVTLSILSSGCMGPPEVPPVEVIAPNETAFVIPLEGDSKAQKQVQSIDYLKEHMVQAKRITIPVRKRSIGRMANSYEWIPLDRVVTVDRSLVTRQWTGMSKTEDGKPNTNPGIHVESMESINFRVGFNVTALVQESDAATYLYWHAGKPLTDIVDTNVRGFIQDIAAREFGSRSLEDCKAQKNAVFEVVAKETIAHFKDYGITIVSVGNAGGLQYEDEAIQTAINKTQTAQMSVAVAEQERLAQDKRNAMTVATATAQREAAEQFAKASEAQIARIGLEIETTKAKAMLTFAEKFDGHLPERILPQGSGFMMGLDAPLTQNTGTASPKK